MNFDAIFKEYYVLYRGQGTNIPTSTSPEYVIALSNANAAIRKWDRSDGTLWNELITSYQSEFPGAVVNSSNHTYPVTLMRKPPTRIRLLGGTAQSGTLKVIPAQDVGRYSSLNGLAYFTGSANKGYVLHMDGDLTQSNGAQIQFTYLKTPTKMVDGTSVPDMSDPTFMVQDMLASRSSNSRNGFLYKAAVSAATTALQNMKIENYSGFYGDRPKLGGFQKDAGWGVNQNADII